LKSRLLCSFLLSGLTFCLLGADLCSAVADTLWSHNQSLMRLVETHNSIEIFYEQPRKDLQERGVKPGTLLYRGAVIKGMVSGIARAYQTECKNPIEFELSGTFSAQQLIALKGQRPLTVDCKATSRLIEESLTFFYQSKAQDAGVKLAQTRVSMPDKAGTTSQPPAKIKLTRLGGVYAVPLQLNDHVVLYGIVDSGASDISIPADILKGMMDDKILSGSDFLDEKTYVMADGSKVAAKRYLIKSVRVGEKELKDVTVSSTPKNGVILLGQSFLGRFKSWSIDNEAHALILD
jgi:predicted aspartyl protease